MSRTESSVSKARAWFKPLRSGMWQWYVRDHDGDWAHGNAYSRSDALDAIHDFWDRAGLPDTYDARPLPVARPATFKAVA